MLTAGSLLSFLHPLFFLFVSRIFPNYLHALHTASRNDFRLFVISSDARSRQRKHPSVLNVASVVQLLTTEVLVRITFNAVWCMKKLCTFPTHCLSVFRMILSAYIDYSLNNVTRLILINKQLDAQFLLYRVTHGNLTSFEWVVLSR